MKNFKGRTAVITGAATGIGRSIALTLAREGVNIVIADIDHSAALATRSEVVDLGVQCLAVKVDVADLASVTELADTSYNEFGNVDILVNNAGVTMRPYRASWDASYADYQWMFAINWWGVLHGFHVFVPRMREQEGDKHIVSTSSMAALIPPPGHAAYAASKAAVEIFSLSAREEFILTQQNIGVSVLYPGPVATRIASSERLRSEGDRSEARAVKPFSDYLPADDKAAEDRRAGLGRESLYDAPIDADLVGPMVLNGIKNNLPAIVTQQVPKVPLQKRAQSLLDAWKG